MHDPLDAIELVETLRDCPAVRHADLLAGVLAAPESAAARRTLGDALRSEGSDWADLVESQLQMDRLPEEEQDLHRGLMREQAAILRRYPRLHLAIGGIVGRRGVLGLRRGLVEHARLPAATLIHRAPDLFALTPLRSVDLCPTGREEAHALARLPHLDRLRQIEIADPKIGDEGVAALVSSEHLAGLESLLLRFVPLSDGTVEELAAPGGIEGLRRLSLDGRLTSRSMLAIARSTKMAALRDLATEGPWVDDEGLDALARGATIDHLDALTIIRGRVGSSLKTLAAAPAGAQLRELALTQAVQDPEVVIEALRSLDRLVRLHLDRCEIGPRGLLALRDGGGGGQLARLSLCSAGLDHQGGRLLADEPLPALRWLTLTRNALADAGATALGAATFAPTLTRLWLDDCGIGPAGASALTAGMSSLVVLDLSGNPIGDVGARALASNEALGRLELLRLIDCGISPAGARALLDSPHLQNVRRIAMSREVGDEVMRELEERRAAGDPYLAV